MVKDCVKCVKQKSRDKQTPKIPNTTNLYEVNADTFQLPKGIILLDIFHRVKHKTPQHHNIPILNAKNVPCSIGKNMPIASMCHVGIVRRPRRSAGAGSGVTPLNYFPRYHKIPVYNLNWIIKV